MRKISIVFLAAAMVMSAACVKEQPALNDGKFSLSVSISSEAPAPLEVKTHLAATVENNQRKVYWSNGDAIAVNGVASSVLSGLADNAASRRVMEKCGFVPEYEGDGDYQGERRSICRYTFHAAV